MKMFYWQQRQAQEQREQQVQEQKQKEREQQRGQPSGSPSDSTSSTEPPKPPENLLKDQISAELLAEQLKFLKEYYIRPSGIIKEKSLNMFTSVRHIRYQAPWFIECKNKFNPFDFEFF